MSEKGDGIIVPPEGSTTPNEARQNMLNLAWLAQILSVEALLRGDKKTWAAYSAIVIAASGIAVALS